MANAAGEHKQEAIDAMLRELGTYGLAAWKPEAVRAKYPKVAKATWHRWKMEAVRLFETDKALRDSYIANAPKPPKPPKVPKEKRLSPRLPKKPPEDIRATAETVTAVMPVIPTVDDVMETGIPAVTKINQCIARAEALMQALQDPDTGAVKNPQLYMTASKHILEAIKTAAAVASVLHDASRVDQFHQAVIRQLEKRDPQLALDVLNDLQQLNQAWMGIA